MLYFRNIYRLVFEHGISCCSLHTISLPPRRYSSEPGNQATGGRPMKTGIKTTAILTALLAGTVVAGAHPQDQRQWQQKGRQGQSQFQRQRQGCPTCGNPQFRPQRQRPQHSGSQFRHDGPPPQFHERQGQRGPNPHQRDQMKQRRRQAILEHFDTDGDGRLSKKERQAVREAMQERKRAKPGGASNRPEPPPAD